EDGARPRSPWSTDAAAAAAAAVLGDAGRGPTGRRGGGGGGGRGGKDCSQQRVADASEERHGPADAAGGTRAHPPLEGGAQEGWAGKPRMEVVVVYILGARRIVFLLPRSLLRHLELTVVDHLRQGRGRRAVHRAAHGPATAEHLFDGAAELLGLALVPHLPHDMSNSCCLVRFPECLMFLVFLRSRIGSFRPLMMRLVAFGSTSTFAARFWIVT
ncbi:unnamed protein product, partial [Prorocentrum cordatum]